MDGVYLVVVEEYGEVVDVALYHYMLPWTTNIVGNISLKSLAVDISKYIEFTFIISDARSPYALTINLFAANKREGRVVEVEAVEAIANLLPVHKVFGMQDVYSWYCVHGGTCKIVVVANTQDVGVRELIIEQRIREGSVAIIGCPRLLSHSAIAYAQ